jgi:protein phosphatase
MGTTIVALLRSQDRYHIANVGDSRAYRVTPNAIQQITKDHSVTAEAIASGHITAEEAKNSRWKNALTRAVGTDSEIEVDIFGPFEVAQPHRVLLCTDGLHGCITQPTMQERVASTADASKAAERLTDEAFRNGSNDNISAAVVVFEGAAQMKERAPINHGQAARANTNYQVILMPEPNHGRHRSWLTRFFSLFGGAA